LFTGIIEEVGSIVRVEPLAGGRRFSVGCSFAPELRVDESVAVSGVCLTVVSAGAGAFDAVAIEETLARSTLGGLAAGGRENLERAVRVGARLDGHVVQGHVDATGEVVHVHELADSRVVRVRYPDTHAALLIEKGSVAVDGVSLTVSRLDEPAGTFEVALIPHTLAHTTAGEWRPGARVNLEFDVLGKYAVRAASLRSDSPADTGGARGDA
jgi:riboflavin synthase